jgi:hypothetical protein
MLRNNVKKFISLHGWVSGNAMDDVENISP